MGDDKKWDAKKKEDDKAGWVWGIKSKTLEFKRRQIFTQSFLNDDLSVSHALLPVVWSGATAERKRKLVCEITHTHQAEHYRLFEVKESQYLLDLEKDRDGLWFLSRDRDLSLLRSLERDLHTEIK